MIPNFRRMQGAVDSVNRVLREQITGVRVVRAFVREDQERERFDEVNTEYTGTALAVGRLMALAFPIVMVVLNASTVAVLWFGAKRVRLRRDADRRAHRLHELPHADPHVGHDGDLHVDDDPAGHRLRRPDRRGPRHRGQRSRDATTPVPIAGRAVRRSSSTASSSPTRARTPRSCTTSPSPRGRARRRRSSGRPGRGRRPWSTSSRGCTTSPVARSGSSGVDIRDIALEDLWAHVGLVPAAALPLHRTVASNLRYGDPDAGDDDLWHALRIAQGADFVAEMAGGLERRRSRRAGRTSPAGSVNGWPSPAPSSAGPGCSSSTTRSPRSTSRPTPGCAGHCAPETRGCDGHRCRTAGLDDRRRRPDHRPRRRGRRRASAGTASCSRAARPIGRSSSRSRGRRRRHERGRQDRRGEGGRGAAGSGPDDARRARRTCGWVCRRRSPRTSSPRPSGCSAPCVRSAPGLDRRARARRRQRHAQRHRAEDPGPSDEPHLRGLLQPALPGRDDPGAGGRSTSGGQGQGRRSPTWSPRWATSPPGHGHRLHRGRPRPPRSSSAIYLVAALLGLAPELPARRRRQPVDLPAASRRRGEAAPAAAALVRRPAARRGPQPGHQRHRQHRPEPAADPEPARHVAAHRRRDGDDDVRHLAAARPHRPGDDPAVDLRDDGRSGSARRRSSSSSGRAPASSTASSRRPSPATRWSRCSAASRPRRRSSSSKNEDLYAAGFGAQFISGIIMPTMMFIGNLNYVAIAVVGGLRIASGSLSLGDFAGVHPVLAPVHPAADPGRLDGQPHAVRRGLGRAGLRGPRRDGAGRRAPRADRPARGPARPGGVRGRVVLVQTPTCPLIENLDLVGRARADGRHRRPDRCRARRRSSTSSCGSTSSTGAGSPSTTSTSPT